MSKREPYTNIAVLSDLLEGKLTDYQIFLKYSIGIQSTIKLRKLLKKYDENKIRTTTNLG